ncbi:hypothetical protein EMIT0P2_60050 [Pseudomonas sp. IT-P2]
MQDASICTVWEKCSGNHKNQRFFYGYVVPKVGGVTEGYRHRLTVVEKLTALEAPYLLGWRRALFF